MLQPSIGFIKVAAVHVLLHHAVENPTLIGKISCWQMLLFEFDIVFMT